MRESLVAIAIQQLPSALALIRAAFVTANPSVPEPTDSEMLAAFESALLASLAKDAAWLAAHPE